MIKKTTNIYEKMENEISITFLAFYESNSVKPNLSNFAINQTLTLGTLTRPTAGDETPRTVLTVVINNQ